MQKLAIRHFYATISVLFLFYSSLVHAGDPTFGGEITLTSDAAKAAQTAGNVVNNPVTEKARDDMAAIMHERCKTAVPKCSVLEGKNKYGVTKYQVLYEDGWWYQIETDPSVVEIQTKEATYKELSTMRDRIQHDIFDLGAQVGLYPSGNLGGGHIHIGMHSALDGYENLFRNFFVDYANHSELGTGIMSFLGNGNAPTLEELTDEQRASFIKILKSYDSGWLKSAKRFARLVQSGVYYANPNRWGPPEKYQALNVTRMIDPKMSEDERTFELRAFPGQRNADDFLLETHLLHRRIVLLRSFKGVVPYHPASIHLSDEVKAARFYRYVTDAGLKWSDYAQFVDEAYRETAPKMGCDLALIGGVP